MRLEKLENIVRYHVHKSFRETGHRYEKKQYEEQLKFNLKVLHHLENVSFLKSNVGKEDIEAGMSLIK